MKSTQDLLQSAKITRARGLLSGGLPPGRPSDCLVGASGWPYPDGQLGASTGYSTRANHQKGELAWWVILSGCTCEDGQAKPADYFKIFVRLLKRRRTNRLGGHGDVPSLVSRRRPAREHRGMGKERRRRKTRVRKRTAWDKTGVARHYS